MTTFTHNGQTFEIDADALRSVTLNGVQVWPLVPSTETVIDFRNASVSTDRKFVTCGAYQLRSVGSAEGFDKIPAGVKTRSYKTTIEFTRLDGAEFTYNGTKAAKHTWTTGREVVTYTTLSVTEATLPVEPTPAVYGNGTISDAGTVAQFVAAFQPLGINAIRPWLRFETDGQFTGRNRALTCKDYKARGFIVHPVLSTAENPSVDAAEPDYAAIMDVVKPEHVDSIGSLNEIDSRTYAKSFDAAAQLSQAIHDKLAPYGYKVDSFSTSWVKAGEIKAAWAKAKALGCTNFNAIRGHAYDWNYTDINGYIATMTRIVTEWYDVAQSLGKPLIIDEWGLPSSTLGSKKTMTDGEVALVMPIMADLMRRYTIASYFFIGSKSNKMPHDSFPRLVDDIATPVATAAGRAFKAAAVAASDVKKN